VGFLSRPPVLSGDGSAKPKLEDWAEGTERTVKWKVGEEAELAWRVKLLPGPRLLLHFDAGSLPDGSKECFVQLLEWAEEELEVSEVLVELDKSRSDLPLLLRTFSYFGFALLPPDKAAFFVDTTKYIAMTYAI